MRTVDAFALDLDGTLLQPGATIHPRTVRALEAVLAAGVQVWIATGRPYPDVVAILGGNLPDALRPHLLICEARDVYTRAGDGYVPREPENTQALDAERAMTARWLPRLDAALAECAALDTAFRRNADETIHRRGYIELTFSTREMARSGEGVVARHIGGAGDARPDVVRNNRDVALRHPRVGKGNVLAQVARARGLRPHRILAVGDSANDLTMLDGRHGFAAAVPANAEEELRALITARGGHVAGSERGLGVAEIMERAIG